MKKRNKDIIIIGIILVGLSIFLHYLHFLIFKDLHHTLIFLFADIAFIPMEVFFTSVVIEKFLERREKSHMIEKINMLIGVFYSELGIKILQLIIHGDNKVQALRKNAILDKNYNENDFKTLEEKFKSYNYELDVHKIDLSSLKNILD
ncbi:hypothetical protein SAMN05443638_1371, partial [Clostridium fallax]